MYISTPPSSEVENFQMKIYYPPPGDRTPDPLNQKQTCYHLSQRGELLLVKLFFQNNNIAAVLREYRRIKGNGEVLFPYRGWRTWFGSSNLLEDRTLRPVFSTIATVSSIITGAIGRRPLQEQFPNRQLIRTSESCSSTPVRKKDLSVFFNLSIFAKSSSGSAIVVVKKTALRLQNYYLVTLSRPMLIVCNCRLMHTDACVSTSGEFSDTPRIPAVYKISVDSKHWWNVFLRKRKYWDFKCFPNKSIKKMSTDYFA